MLVTEEAQCLMASLGRVEQPADEVAMQETLRTMLGQVIPATTYDVAATRLLEAEQQLATERQQQFLEELEQAETIVSLAASKKKKKKKKKKKQEEDKELPTAAEIASLIKIP
eukprot:SAG31_NODE_23847_length_494_cov_0.913924_1_plen_112_part_10